MRSNWVTTTEAIAMISKKSHHQVSPDHLHTLVNRGKIGVRYFQRGMMFLKRSDVAATRVASDVGNSIRRDKHEERQ